MSATLAELARVLDQIADLAAAGRDAFDNDHRQCWSIERLWIYTGNLADRHCREAGIDDGGEPWAELVRTRNLYAHYTPDQIVADRVWNETTSDIDRLRRAVTEAQR
ncbi:MAG: hypothetical protein ACRDYY_17445 [Acidimicrobiales bacterium]